MSSKKDKDQTRADRLEELALALKQAQLMLLEQSTRLDAVTKGDSDSAQQLEDARQRLAVVTAERDQLQKQLLALERMQTETIALTEEPEEREDGEEGEPLATSRPSLPTIEDLMQARLDLDAASEASQGRLRRLNGPSAEAPDSDWSEMISPEVIVPEAFDEEADAAERQSNKRTPWLLVSMDKDEPMQIPLHEGTMTIGRSESAHIRLDGEYVSRIHARIVCRSGKIVIEDAGSKNGFKINSVAVTRHDLNHGDVITIGKRHFAFVDTSREDT